MKQALFIFLLLGVHLFGAELVLEKSFKEAIVKCNTLEKPLMFIISRHTCKYCILLEKETLSQAEVIEKLNKDYVVSIAYTDDGDGFPQELWRNATPTIWFLNENGEAMSEPIMGTMDKTNLLQVLEMVKARFDEEKNLTQYNYTKNKL